MITTGMTVPQKVVPGDATGAAYTPSAVDGSDRAIVVGAGTAGTPVGGVVSVQDVDTGASVHYRTSTGATEDKHEIKATAGRLYAITVTNTNAAARYLRLYNLTAASTTPGTSTVFIGLAIPGSTAGSGFTVNFGPLGVAFSVALTGTFTTGAADTDTTEVAANEIKAVYAFK